MYLNIELFGVKKIEKKNKKIKRNTYINHKINNRNRHRAKDRDKKQQERQITISILSSPLLPVRTKEGTRGRDDMTSLNG